MAGLPIQCVILAGGRGTRLGSLTDELPKALVDIAGRPFLHYQLELLRTAGVRDVVLCVGYLGSVIERSIGDGSRFGMSIRYSYDGDAPLGTAGALRNALPLLQARFLVTYGDTLLPVDHRQVARSHAESGLPALMTVLKNENRWDASNAVVEEGRVVAYSKSPPPRGARWIDYGLLAFTRAAATAGDNADLEAELTVLARSGLLGAYEVDQRFYQIGDPAGLAETAEFIRTSPRFSSVDASGRR
jgi:N-acetyl-alpha-D-muramate 1-phosphate uridylyltransferase